MKKIDWDEVWKHTKVYGSVGPEDKLAIWVLGIFLGLIYLVVLL